MESVLIRSFPIAIELLYSDWQPGSGGGGGDMAVNASTQSLHVRGAAGRMFASRVRSSASMFWALFEDAE